MNLPVIAVSVWLLVMPIALLLVNSLLPETRSAWTTIGVPFGIAIVASSMVTWFAHRDATPRSLRRTFVLESAATVPWILLAIMARSEGLTAPMGTFLGALACGSIIGNGLALCTSHFTKRLPN